MTLIVVSNRVARPKPDEPVEGGLAAALLPAVRHSGAIWVGSSGRLAAEGDHSGAIEHLRRSIDLFPTAGAWTALGTQYRAEGEADLALAAFDAAIELDSRAWAAHYERAVALLAKAPRADGDPLREEAIRSLERTLELRPGHPGASQLLARVRRELDTFEQSDHGGPW